MLRDTIVALGLGLLLAACPAALVVPAAATAAPAREASPAAAADLAQVDPVEDPGAQDPGDIQSTDPGDEDDGEEQDPGEVGTPNPIDQPVGKMYPVEPDSLLKARTTPPPGGGALDTLKAVSPRAAAFDTLRAAPRKPGAAPQAPQRGTILGLSPLIFFAGILAVHVLVVKAVNE
ncbi:MAG TPA: hypothetical protein VFS09_10935 [Candidatus Eisenbacteria bacterium]|nr:hypothetical protein [Candidatus Eisenbacteria bacterium]